MALTTLDGYIAAPKQKIVYFRSGARTTVANSFFAVFDLGGNPGAGTLAVGNTANGLVPTDATAGYPPINAFAGANKGYLTGVQFGSSVACRIMLYDRLFHAGAYAFNAATTLASQPSFSSRVPGGTDFTGTELWVECVTAFTGTFTITVTYTNQAGTTGRSTGSINAGTPIVGRMAQFPLQAGDSGLQKIESVTATVASAGTFNLMILRPLWEGRVQAINDGGTHGFGQIGMPEVFADSALQIAVNTDLTAAGIPELLIEIANG